MGMNLDTIISIKARATGGEQLQALSDKISGVEAVTKRLTTSSGILTSALGALAPIASIAGLGALIKSQIDAGDKMKDLSQKTGVSVEMLAKFDKAAKISGITLDTVAGGIVKLSRALVAAAAGTSMGDRIKEDAKKAEVAIRDGERTQTRLVKEGADQRIEALEKESEKALGEIAKRYRRIEQLINRQFDDREEIQERYEEQSLRMEQKAIDRTYEEKEKAIRDEQSLSEKAKEEALRDLADQREDELDQLRYRYQDQAKERRRQSQDEQQQKLNAIQAQREKEEAAIKDKNKAQQQLIKDAADKQIESIKGLAEESIRALKKNEQADELAGQLEELGLSGKGASEAFRQLGIEIKNSDGTLRSADDVLLNIADRFSKMPDGIEKTVLATKLFGKSGADMIPMLNLGANAIDNMRVAMTQAFAEKADEYSDKLTILGGKVGGLARGLTVALLPALIEVTNATTKIVEAFGKLPEPIQKTIGGIALFSMALGALKFTGILSGLGAIIGAFRWLAAFRIGAIIAGSLGAVAPVVAAITTALSGLLAWMGSVLVPGILAVFSGPAGWIALAVAAVVAGALLFRKPITEFFSWIGKAVGDWAQPFTQFFDNNVIKPLINLWNKIKEPVSNLFTNIAWLAGQAFNGLIALGYKIFIEPWVQLWSVIKEPVSDLFEYYTTGAQVAWDSLVKLGYNIFVKPWVELWGVIKKPVLELFGYFSAGAKLAWDSLVKLGYEIFIKPWTDLWGAIRKPAGDAWDYITKLGKGVFDGIIKWIYDKFIKPWEKAWSFITMEPSKFKKAVIAEFEQIKTDTIKIFEGIGNAIKKPFEDIINGLFARIQSFIASNKNAINEVILVYNRVAENINRLPTIVKPFGMRDMPLLQPVTAEQAKVPRLARGGWISSPTLAWVGDTGRAEGEYAIPGEMMPAAVAAWNQGARGDALVAAMRSGGGGPAAGGGGLRTQLNLTLQTGPVLQQPDGSQWVRQEELQSVAEAVFAAAVELQSSSAARSVNGWS